MTKSLKYFMWGYQEHFAHHLGYEAEQVLAALGLGKVVARGAVIGVISPGRSNPNAVCLCPEDGVTNLGEWEKLPTLVARTVKEHPMQAMFFGDAPSMADKPENILRDSVRCAVAEIIEPMASADGRVAFVGTAAPVGDFHVTPVVEVDASVLLGDFVLPAPVVCNRWTAAPSLAHAAIYQILEEATAELQRKDPGRYIGARGLERDELIRRAGAHFMHGPSLALGDPVSAVGFFDVLNEISSLLYERKHGRGVLALARPDDPSITFDLRFARPVRLRNVRWSRKLLEMGNADLALIADAEAVHGLGRRAARPEGLSSVYFDVEFLGQHRWWMKANGLPVIRSDFGVPSIPRRFLDRTSFTENFRRVFAASSAADANRAADLFEAVEQLGHGCMILFAEDAGSEATRLAGQGTPTTPLPMTPAVLGRVSGIDGTVLLDPASMCHAVGVILDGPAHQDCDPARGSRYNSAIRYVRAGLTGRLAIVASDDGMIAVIPLLRPCISRKRLREVVETLEAANSQNFHVARNWLMDHKFYLDGQMCRRVNAAMKRIEEEPREVGQIWLVWRPVKPSPDLDDSYFIEDDGPRTTNDAPA